MTSFKCDLCQETLATKYCLNRHRDSQRCRLNRERSNNPNAGSGASAPKSAQPDPLEVAINNIANLIRESFANYNNPLVTEADDYSCFDAVSEHIFTKSCDIIQSLKDSLYNGLDRDEYFRSLKDEAKKAFDDKIQKENEMRQKDIERQQYIDGIGAEHFKQLADWETKLKDCVEKKREYDSLESTLRPRYQWLERHRLESTARWEKVDLDYECKILWCESEEDKKEVIEKIRHKIWWRYDRLKQEIDETIERVNAYPQYISQCRKDYEAWLKDDYMTKRDKLLEYGVVESKDKAYETVWYSVIDDLGWDSYVFIPDKVKDLVQQIREVRMMKSESDDES